MNSMTWGEVLQVTVITMLILGYATNKIWEACQVGKKGRRES